MNSEFYDRDVHLPLLTNFQAEVNLGDPELLAQLLWTGASPLESDLPGEYAMAARLIKGMRTIRCNGRCGVLINTIPHFSIQRCVFIHLHQG